MSPETRFEISYKTEFDNFYFWKLEIKHKTTTDFCFAVYQMRPKCNLSKPKDTPRITATHNDTYIKIFAKVTITYYLYIINKNITT